MLEHKYLQAQIIIFVDCWFFSFLDDGNCLKSWDNGKFQDFMYKSHRRNTGVCPQADYLIPSLSSSQNRCISDHGLSIYWSTACTSNTGFCLFVKVHRLDGSWGWNWDHGSALYQLCDTAHTASWFTLPSVLASSSSDNVCVIA